MTRFARGTLGFGVAALMFGGGTALSEAPAAYADTCTNDVGNRATVSVCADLSDIVREIIEPGRVDRGPGNLTPNTQTCLGWDGRWVESDSCT